MSSRNRCREIMSLFLIILIASACNSFSSQSGQYPGTVGTFQETGNYQINPETILSSLDNGKKDNGRGFQQS